MKKIILLIAIIMYQSYASEPIKGAVYAEIRGISGGRIRIYKGINFSHNHSLNLLSRLWSPKVYFFDRQGRKLAQEEFVDKHLLQNSSNNYEKAIKNIRARLTELPKAHHAEIYWIKAPGYQFIKVFDENGVPIAITRAHWDRAILKVGDNIPQKNIDTLKNYISNPDSLHSFKLEKIINGLSLLNYKK